MSEFIAEHGGVTWLTSRGPIRLNEQMVEGLLDLFGEADDLAAAKLFNELHEESLKLGGIERSLLTFSFVGLIHRSLSMGRRFE